MPRRRDEPSSVGSGAVYVGGDTSAPVTTTYTYVDVQYAPPPPGPSAVSGGARRVFLSHTGELRKFPTGYSFVTAVERGVSRAGDAVVDMEYFTAQDSLPANYCVERVKNCEVYLAIVGFRYGSPVCEQPQLSYTELEFNTASQVGIPRLIFMLDEDAQVPYRLFHDNAYGERQIAFRARLKDSGLIVATFSAAAELENLAYQALTELKRRSQPETERRSTEGAQSTERSFSDESTAGSGVRYTKTVAPDGTVTHTVDFADQEFAGRWLAREFREEGGTSG
ncbi:DUF4062 domain-containing protein [Frankia sp. Cj5]|uniref:DUF4062 domain-containing protein n=1 Tax=Frankia sp. Cj5 TaxID=2880978 RepID=UPI002103699A|nr:DUF4062 domain-containing protein [Frankia sp. Cj5]